VYRETIGKMNFDGLYWSEENINLLKLLTNKQFFTSFLMVFSNGFRWPGNGHGPKCCLKSFIEKD